MQTDVVSRVRKDLAGSVDENTKNSCSRFFKEEVKCYGVKSSVVGKIAKDYFKELKNAGQADKKNIFFLCEELLQSDYCEEAYIAFEWAYLVRAEYTEADFSIFEHWVENYVNNWAKCDTLCNHAVGSFIEKFPPYIENLKLWTQSDNRWLRRASAVTLVLPARKGLFLPEIFEISDLLLTDKDDLVRKGYGWMLKEASKPHLQEVFDYVMKNKKEMPRTSLRYAIEKFPEDLRAKAMEK
ncbi:DNA alkylation repair protein [Methanosarcina sp. 1.H.T.1A.1]|uniref:DNA alkylation repair protein n=1 Tax=Methanosarcina sp. 1.H.T.1A.1 TaxID=1483602 RepID=UPI0006217483|nr:DNA alkylation repair protein [Methanosarcina sp. 1.H.T.1A.1]KKH98900.1 DNA alkylation repair protein [Methanosarcina sp. 1.H.T.1A.1]